MTDLLIMTATAWKGYRTDHASGGVKFGLDPTDI